MYGLKQVVILAYKQLVKNLDKYGYYPIPLTTGLWKHKTRDTGNYNMHHITGPDQYMVLEPNLLPILMYRTNYQLMECEEFNRSMEHFSTMVEIMIQQS